MKLGARDVSAPEREAVRRKLGAWDVSATEEEPNDELSLTIFENTNTKLCGTFQVASVWGVFHYCIYQSHQLLVSAEYRFQSQRHVYGINQSRRLVSAEYCFQSQLRVFELLQIRLKRNLIR